MPSQTANCAVLRPNPVSLGTWTNVWLVGGVQVGIEYTYEVIDKPTGLTVQSAGLANPNCSLDGVWIDVIYKITGASGQITMFNTNLLFEPWEDVTFYNTNNQVIPPLKSNAVGGSGTAWSPPSAQYAPTDGSGHAFFHDIPVGTCPAFTYSNWDFGKQVLSMKVVSAGSGSAGTQYLSLLTQFWIASSSGPGAGSIHNNIGTVSVTR